MKLVYFDEAVELCRATDPAAFKREAEKHNCLFVRGGVTRVDVEKLQLKLDTEFATMIEAADKPKTNSANPGKQIGLIRARLTQYPARMLAKQAKIKSAEQAVADSKDRYTRVKGEAGLAKLRREYENLVAGKARDEKLLDELLNSDYDSETVVA